MNWSSPVCENNFSRKDSMQRHMSSKQNNRGFIPFGGMFNSREKCQRFQFIHPFTCMVAGMTGSGKTAWVQTLLRQAQNVIDPPPQRIVWCYSQWQPAYMVLVATIPQIEFVKGIPPDLEHDSYFDVNKRNLLVFDDQMIDAGGNKRIVNLFTRGPHHRNLSVICIVQNVFHQGKGSRSISLNSHYLVLFKNPRGKLQIVTLAKQMYPGQTHSFIQRYEEAVQRPFGYPLVDLKTTTQDNCRLGTNVLSGEERFDRGGMQQNISQELLQYLKQQNIATPPVLPAIQQLRDNMDSLLARTDLGDYEKARQYVQLQNKYLTFQHQLNSRNQEPKAEKEILTNSLRSNLPTSIQDQAISQPTPAQTQAAIPATLVHAPAAIQETPISAPSVVPAATPLKTSPPLPPPGILTPHPTMEMPPPSKRKRKLPRIQFRNYLDDDTPKRRSRRIHRHQLYKYSKDESD